MTQRCKRNPTNLKEPHQSLGTPSILSEALPRCVAQSRLDRRGDEVPKAPRLRDERGTHSLTPTALERSDHCL